MGSSAVGKSVGVLDADPEDTDRSFRDLVGGDAEPAPPVEQRGRRALLVAAEGVVSIGMAVLMVVLALKIDVNPLDRVGQISGLAALQLRFALLGLVMLVAVVVAARSRWAVLSPLAERLAAAAVAGLTTGLVGGAVAVALHGSSWGLNASFGDGAAITRTVRTVLETGGMQADYPPGAIYGLAWYTQLTGGTPDQALKAAQILGTALFGPIAYLTWRLLLPPLWALGIGIVPALPLVEPYKFYPSLMLIVLIPVLLKLLQQLRRAGTIPWSRLVLTGVGVGTALGLVFLIYSGWFVWSAPGVIVTALVVFPWRTGLLRGVTLTVVTTAMFVLVSSRHLFGLLTASGSVKDRYFHIDTWVEPTYFVMGKGDLPGANPGPWPPPGELGGVGLFTILLFAGLVALIVVARRRTIVIALSSIIAGAWVLRYYFAAQMYGTDSVQLYPRTSPQLLYCFLLAFGFAIYYIARSETVRARLAKVSPASMGIGVLAGLMLLTASAGSAIGDKYMPRSDNSVGSLAFNAHVTRGPDGKCSRYTSPDMYRCMSIEERIVEVGNAMSKSSYREGELPHFPPPYR
jgi:galactan 5-O-arabinofuranosyltransferase